MEKRIRHLLSPQNILKNKKDLMEITDMNLVDLIMIVLNIISIILLVLVVKEYRKLIEVVGNDE